MAAAVEGAAEVVVSACWFVGEKEGVPDREVFGEEVDWGDGHGRVVTGRG